MNKDTNTTPIALSHENLDKVQGGFALDVGATETVKNRRPRGVLIGQQGNDFLDGGAGQDSVLRGGAGNDT